MLKHLKIFDFTLLVFLVYVLRNMKQAKVKIQDTNND